MLYAEQIPKKNQKKHAYLKNMEDFDDVSSRRVSCEEPEILAPNLASEQENTIFRKEVADLSF